MTVAIDTNVLVYAEGLNGAEKKRTALDVLTRLPPESTFIPVQVLAELLTVLSRKAGRSRRESTAAVLGWGDAFPLIDTSSSVLLSAMDLVTAHQFSTWDAVVLAASADAGCRVLLSEDMQEGFTWGGVTVVNPFARSMHPLLDAALARSSPDSAVMHARPASTARSRRRRT